mmetsp:Transcript_120879/g.303922  ORF Transcript_120879/g.303922 Transcript_120879/m.303922 type:complete len:432 (+) Transcript_120879:428-1723(+)
MLTAIWLHCGAGPALLLPGARPQTKQEGVIWRMQLAALRTGSAVPLTKTRGQVKSSHGWTRQWQSSGLRQTKKKRWISIASRVGGGRTAKECADRFRKSRSRTVVVNRIEQKDSYSAFNPPERSAASASSAPQSRGDPPSEHSVAEVKRLGVEVRLLGLSLEGFSTLLLATLRLQLVCSRCKKVGDIQAECHGTDARTAEASCATCKHRISVAVAPSICHGGCPSVAHVLGTDCHVVQLLHSDVMATCGQCTQEVRIRNVGPGYRKRSSCTECHTKLNLAVEGADILGTGVAHWRQVASEEGDRQTARKQLQDARRHERELGIRVGTPLPEQGACSHFKKSYRWLRFPCCGRTFPCGECHDEQMDHVHEWANRMLCGHCSFEQPYSRECSNCGAAPTRSRTAFWEGGEGCRNQVTMSRNDPHKYKGLSKRS